MDALPPSPPALVAASATADARPAQPAGAKTEQAASPGGAKTEQDATPAGLLDFLPRRDPGTAALLSLAINGGGQFYNGETAKGWWMLGSWALYPLAWAADQYLQTGYFRTGAVLVGLGVKGYSIWDAHSTASRAREEAR